MLQVGATGKREMQQMGADTSDLPKRWLAHCIRYVSASFVEHVK
jgi:hypothetical protein